MNPRSPALPGLLAILLSMPGVSSALDDAFFEKHCYECHDDVLEKGGLNLLDLEFDFGDPQNFQTWERVFDQVDSGAMPPKEQKRPGAAEQKAMLAALGKDLNQASEARVGENGRAQVRRWNRREYENALRELLQAPGLQVADRLPVDGTAHLFDKTGERLDVSHVQMMKYLETAEFAIRKAMNAAAFPETTERYYIREEPVPVRYVHYWPLQHSATRAGVPLIGTEVETDILRREQPMTVGDADPERRNQEAIGFFSGTFEATTKYDFTKIKIPIDGRYRLKVKSYSFLGGLNGRSGGNDNGLTGGREAWWRPSRTEALPGNRSEPVTLYALAPSGDSRWLTTYDAHPSPEVIEREVLMREGEGIRPDAARLVRTRPGWDGNPLATKEGIPGFAMQWIEVTGPLQESWPPPSYAAIFGDLPFEVTEEQQVRVVTENEDAQAESLLRDFAGRAWRQTEVASSESIAPYLGIYHKARRSGEDFTQAMVMAFTSVLCSPEFLYHELQPGELDSRALAIRLSAFLHDQPIHPRLLALENLNDLEVLRRETERLMKDPKFAEPFLDFWLDLRDLQANAPDAALYPDYYLDELLTESSLLETQMFFRDLIVKDRPARFLVDADYTFVNERLAQHYGLPASPGVELKKVSLPEDSPRGGLMTQASVLKVTANGTTTSPVLRGAWITERLLGVHIPPPPSGIAAVEPDTRGATTIREQLELHNAAKSCAACHDKFDPAGFALEAFDVAGGFRQQYRALNSGSGIEPPEGFGKNGHEFEYHYAQPIDASGELKDGRTFSDIRGLKALLLEDERQIARNLVHRLIVYGTGAPVHFFDRDEVEAILDRAEASEYGVRTLIHEIVQSELFRMK